MSLKAANLRSLLTVLVAALVVLSLIERTPAAERASPKSVKANFLRSLPRYFTWPAASFIDAKAPFVIGVVGEDPFGGTLDRTVAGHKVKNRRFSLKRIPTEKDRLPSQDELTAVHMLFVSDSEAARLLQILDLLRGTPVVTVSDVEDFAAAGGIVELKLTGANIKPRLNRSAAHAAGIEISAKLSKIAIDPEE